MYSFQNELFKTLKSGAKLQLIRDLLLKTEKRTRYNAHTLFISFFM